MIANILPANFLVPGTAMKFDLTNAIRGLRGMPRSLMLVGYANKNSPELLKGAAIQVTSEKHAVAVAGEHSVLHQMYKALPNIVRLAMPVHFFRLDESIGEKHAYKFILDLDQPLAEDVPLQLNLNGYTASVTMPKGSTREDVRDLLFEFIDDIRVQANIIVSLPEAEDEETPAPDNEIIFHSAFGGYESKGLVVCAYGPEKSTVAFGIATEPLSQGEGDHDTTALQAYLLQNRITQIAWPGAMSDAVYADMSSFLVQQWGADAMRETQAVEVLGVPDSSAAMAALNARNCHQVSTFIVGMIVRSPVWAMSAWAAGEIEYSAAIDPARPYRDLGNGEVSPPVDMFDRQARQQILLAGGSTFVEQGGKLFIDRVVTNYTKNIGGIEDASYRNLEWIKTMSWWRWFVTTEFGLKYRNFKLATDSSMRGEKIMTTELAEEVILSLYQDAIKAGLMQHFDGYQADLKVEIDGVAGRLKYLEKPRLMGQHYQTEITSEPVLGSA